MGNYFKWPVWLPYPINWLRAAGNLFLWWSLTEGMLESVFKNRDDAFHCWPDELGSMECPSAVSRGTFLLFAFFVNLIIQVFLVAIAHHWIARLQGKSRGWFPRWSSWREGLNGSIAIFLGGVVILIGAILLVALFPHWLTVRTLIPAILVGALVINAYLHHYDYRVRERRAARKVAKHSQAKPGNKKRGKGGNSSPGPLPKPATPPPPPPVDPIDLELDRLRGEMGLNQMWRKKPPENSQ